MTKKLADEFGNIVPWFSIRNFRTKLLESDGKFGFIIVDGNGSLFGTVSGDTREVLHELHTVDLPSRRRQCARRCARLRLEKLHKHMRTTAELATQFYIDSATSELNVSGLVLAGPDVFKTEFSQPDMFDPRCEPRYYLC